ARLAFAAPELRRVGPIDDSLLERIAKGLGIALSSIRAHQWVDNGPGWVAVLLESADQVLQLRPDMAVLADLKLGVVAPWPKGGEAQFEVRAFVGPLGITEDPVTGSLNA